MYFFHKNLILYSQSSPYNSYITPLSGNIIHSHEDFSWLDSLDVPKNLEWKSIWEIPAISSNLQSLICQAQSQRFEVMPSFNSQLINSIHKIPAPKEIILFPGSFNPFHSGHIQCSKLIKKPLLILPDYNPQKYFDKKNSPWDLCQGIQKELEENKLVYPGFLIKDKTNPTAHWIQLIRKHHPNIKIELLQGADSFNSLYTWIDYSQLLKDINGIHVVARGEETLKQKEKITNDFPHLRTYFYLDNPHQDISSTKIRQKILDESNKQR